MRKFPMRSYHTSTWCRNLEFRQRLMPMSGALNPAMYACGFMVGTADRHWLERTDFCPVQRGSVAEELAQAIAMFTLGLG